MKRNWDNLALENLLAAMKQRVISGHGSGWNHRKQEDAEMLGYWLKRLEMCQKPSKRRKDAA